MAVAGGTNEGLPDASGIYFVWNNGQVVYVGRSARLSARCFISQKHHAIFHGDLISWLEEPLARLKIMEAFYIGTLKPARNFNPKESLTA